MRVLAVVVVALVVSGCGAQIPLVTPTLVTAAQGRWPTATAASLTRGREILTTRCAKCHSPPGPSDHSEDEWLYYIHEMAPRAELDATQKDELVVFLFAARLPTAATP